MCPSNPAHPAAGLAQRHKEHGLIPQIQHGGMQKMPSSPPTSCATKQRCNSFSQVILTSEGLARRLKPLPRRTAQGPASCQQRGARPPPLHRINHSAHIAGVRCRVELRRRDRPVARSPAVENHCPKAMLAGVVHHVLNIPGGASPRFKSQCFYRNARTGRLLDQVLPSTGAPGELHKLNTHVSCEPPVKPGSRITTGASAGRSCTEGWEVSQACQDHTAEASL